MTEPKYKAIPISAARDIAKAYGKDQVIVVAWDQAHGKQHVTTYGKTAAECEQAAEGGNRVKRALGWPENLCSARPARSLKKKAMEACAAAAEMIAEGLRVKGLEQAAMGAEQVARELRGGLTMVQVAQAALVALTPNEIGELLEQMPVIAAAQAVRDEYAPLGPRNQSSAIKKLIAELEAAKL
jgi:hypothetical protein